MKYLDLTKQLNQINNQKTTHNQLFLVGARKNTKYRSLSVGSKGTAVITAKGCEEIIKKVHKDDEVVKVITDTILETYTKVRVVAGTVAKGSVHMQKGTY